MQSQDNKENRKIGFEIKSANNLVRRRLDIYFAKAGVDEISGVQGPMLRYINDYSKERDVFQRDLEKEFHIRRSTATVLLQNMEQKGYIRREPVERDARLKKIVVTDKAVKADQAIRKQLDAFNEELEAGITREEKEVFLKILDKIMQNLV